MKSVVYSHRFVKCSDMSKVHQVISRFAAANKLKRKKCKTAIRYRLRSLDSCNYLEYNINGDELKLDFYSTAVREPCFLSLEKWLQIMQMSFEKMLNPLFRELSEMFETSTYKDMIEEQQKALEEDKTPPYSINYSSIPASVDEEARNIVRTRWLVFAAICTVLAYICAYNGIYPATWIMAFNMLAAVFALSTRHIPLAAITYACNMGLMIYLAFKLG